MLAVLQTFDPAGVCARNLTECLAIQLRDRNRYDPAMAALCRISIFWPSAISRRCASSAASNEEDLADMIAEIKRLNPKPGLAFGSTMVQPIVPDVFVRPTPDGALAVELNSDTLPKVLINQSYHARVVEDGAAPTRKNLSRRIIANRDLADPRARSARPHHPEGRRPRS